MGDTRQRQRAGQLCPRAKTLLRPGDGGTAHQCDKPVGIQFPAGGCDRVGRRRRRALGAGKRHEIYRRKDRRADGERRGRVRGGDDIGLHSDRRLRGADRVHGGQQRRGQSRAGGGLGGVDFRRAGAFGQYEVRRCNAQCCGCRRLRRDADRRDAGSRVVLTRPQNDRSRTR